MFFLKRTSTFFSSKRKYTVMRKSTNGRCSVRKVFFFATSPCFGHWLTCFARKGYSHWRLFFCQIILSETKTEGIPSARNSAALVQKINSELVLFAEYSVIWQSTSRYRAFIGSYLLRIENKNVIFSGNKKIP